MAKLTSNQEKDAVDVVTNTMFSLSFLDTISKVIFGPNRNEITVGAFYDQWLAKTSARDMKIPFNPGIFIAYLFVGLLVTKENWADLLPDKELNNVPSDWGLDGVCCIAPKQPSPKLAYFIRRLRNALGHCNFFFEIPDDLHSVDELHSNVKITFRDQNQRDLSDTFETSLTLIQLEQLIKKFHSIVHTTIANKYGIKKI